MPDFQPPVGGYGGGLRGFDARRYPQPVPGYLPPLQAPPVQQPAYPAGQFYPPYGSAPQAQLPQRPAAITLAATLAVTAALQWVAGLTLLWLVAVAGGRQLGTTGADGVMFHILNRFDARMATGLAWPLYGFPLASLLLGFLLATRASWVRIAMSILGAAAMVWLAWLLRDDLTWWLVPGAYIAVTVALLWTSAANRWYAWRPPSDPTAQPR